LRLPPFAEVGSVAQGTLAHVLEAQEHQRSAVVAVSDSLQLRANVIRAYLIKLMPVSSSEVVADQLAECPSGRGQEPQINELIAQRESWPTEADPAGYGAGVEDCSLVGVPRGPEGQAGISQRQ